MNVAAIVSEKTFRDDSGLTEIRIETLKMLVLLIVALAFVAVLASLSAIPSDPGLAPWDPLPLLGGLIGVALASSLSFRFGLLVSTGVMIAGLTITLTGVLLLHPGSAFAEYFFVIVLAATGALGWPAGLAAAVLASGIIAFIGQASGGVIPGDVAGRSLAFVWITLPLAWLPSRPLLATIQWAWSSYHLAQSKTEEARLRQAELAKVSKSLAEACERLERLNQELHEARDAAEAARRMKAEFAATVGHELRTPVNLIIGFSQMMALNRRSAYYTERLPEAYRDDIATIYHNACHISSLVDDILDLSQIDAQRMALRKEVVDLSHVARDAAASVMPLFSEAGLYLSVDVPEDLPRISADPVRIRQILINLLYNAVRFTHHGGVVVSGYLTDTDVVVTVQDTGVGIPAVDLDRLFEEYRQGQSRVSGHPGSGLGLAVCKRFAELHGGNIWAESVIEHGTTISFSLPIHGNVATVPFRSLASPVSSDGNPVLDVAALDPTGESARIFGRYLDGYHVHEIKKPGRARQLVKNGELRAMIVSSPSAQRSWYDYQQAHQEVCNVPTFYCPVRSREAIAASLNASEYLTKPVSQEQLVQALHRLPRLPRTIVVIEDDPKMRVLLTRILHAISPRCRVSEAADGITGLDLVRQSRPDAVLLDLLIPGQDGYAVLEALRSDPGLSSVPVIVVSARGPDEEIVVGEVGVSRRDGLTVGEAMNCLRAGLDALLRPARVEPADGEDDGRARAPRAAAPV